MEHYFDQFQFLEQFDVKAQNKPQRKRKWLLSREYLQPLTEAEEEELCMEKKAEITNEYKKKLLCAYEAARHGMKEGVLTGMFLGGFWGIFKYLGLNFQFGFSEPEIVGISQKETKIESNAYSQRPAEKGSKIPVAMTQSYSVLNPKGSADQKNTEKHIKNVTVMCSKLPEKNFYNAATDHLIDLSKSKLPVRIDKVSSLDSDSAGFFESNQYFRRKREKVEIVGYAFIKTTNSINDPGSDGSNSPKNSESTSGKVNQTRKTHRRDSIPKSCSTAGASHRMLPGKNTSSPTESSLQSGKSSDNEKHEREDSIYSRFSATEIELTKTNLSDQVEESDVKAENQTISLNEESEVGSNTGNPISDEGEPSARSSVSSWKYSKKETKNSGPGGVKTAKIASKRDSHRPTMVRDSGRKFTRKKSRIDGMDNFRLSNKMSEAENLYPNFKKLGSILVDIENISNGFTSPPSFPQSRKVSMFNPEDKRRYFRKDQIDEEKIERALKNQKFDSDEYDEYIVETSPMFNRSFSSANKKESVQSSITYDSSYENDSYVVESSPAIKGSYAGVTHDGYQKEGKPSNTSAGELQPYSSKIPLYCRYYGIETLTPGGSPYSSRKKVTRFNDTPTELGSYLKLRKQEQRDASVVNEKSNVSERNSEDKDSLQGIIQAAEKQTSEMSAITVGNSSSSLSITESKKNFSDGTFVTETRTVTEDSSPSPQNVSPIAESRKCSTDGSFTNEMTAITGVSSSFLQRIIQLPESRKHSTDKSYTSVEAESKKHSADKSYTSVDAENKKNSVDKSYTNETAESKKHSVDKSCTSVAAESKKHSADKFNTSVAAESKKHSADKSYTSEAPESKKYSADKPYTSEMRAVTGDTSQTRQTATQTSEKKYFSEKSYMSEAHGGIRCSTANDISNPKKTESRRHAPESSFHKRPLTDDKYYKQCSLDGGCSLNRRQVEKSFSSDNPTYEKSRVRIMESAIENKQTLAKAEDIRKGRVQRSEGVAAVHVPKSTKELTLVEPGISKDRPSHRYMKTERDVRAGKRADGIVKKVSLVTETPALKKVQSLDAVRDQDEPLKKHKPSRGFDFLSSVNENVIIVSACNCAIVLGVVCSIISMTRASLTVW